MKLILKLTLNSFTLAIVAYLVPGFEFSGLVALVVAAVVIGIVNTLINPILQLLFFPLTIVTFGITAFLINVVLLWAVSFLVAGFTIENFTTAVISSIVLTLVSWFLNSLSKERRG